MKKNGGFQNTQSKKSDSNLKIIGNSSEQTEDIKNTIDYLENVIINKDTLKTLDIGELVLQINRLIQYVDVLSSYKKPTFKLIEMYETISNMLSNGILTQKRQKYLETKRDIIKELIGELKLEEIIVKRKEYWEDYE